MYLSCCQDKNCVGRRLFERFEKRVECLCRKHVDFVDDVDFIFALRGRKVDLVAQVANIVHTGVGGGVNLDQVEETVLVDRFAILTLVVGAFRWVRIQAIDRFRQKARERGLACPTRPSEEIGVRDAVCRDGILESRDDVVLPHDFVPFFWPVFSIECLGHIICTPLVE
jgi:hypothetical protein